MSMLYMTAGVLSSSATPVLKFIKLEMRLHVALSQWCNYTPGLTRASGLQSRQ